mmetsp:Transcript_54486/g.158288  ORF Transcript_54486/g.158288 Transcript_54486/m.158288 type:complete len:205 (+) Transcript_54486:1473-2087(+)
MSAPDSVSPASSKPPPAHAAGSGAKVSSDFSVSGSQIVTSAFLRCGLPPAEGQGLRWLPPAEGGGSAVASAANVCSDGARDWDEYVCAAAESRPPSDLNPGDPKRRFCRRAEATLCPEIPRENSMPDIDGKGLRENLGTCGDDRARSSRSMRSCFWAMVAKRWLIMCSMELSSPRSATSPSSADTVLRPLGYNSDSWLATVCAV